MTEPGVEPVVVTGGDMVLQPGRRLLVTGRTREPRPKGLGLVVLAIIVAMLCAYVGILLMRASAADRERSELACQVQRLGGRPVGDVDCPRLVKPSPTATPSAPASQRPTATSRPAAATSQQPAGAGAGARAVPASSPPAATAEPTRSPSASRPASPSPSPSTTCLLHHPLTGRCRL
jgi:hypothetical protein